MALPGTTAVALNGLVVHECEITKQDGQKKVLGEHADDRHKSTGKNGKHHAIANAIERIILDEQFAGNLTQVFVSGGKTADRNVWQGNYWSDYQGFDRDGDEVGDTPYELFSYADRLWRDVNYAQFYKGSPILEVLDFLERLAPFSKPDLILRDEAPRLNGIVEVETEVPEEPVKKSALEMLRNG